MFHKIKQVDERPPSITLPSAIDLFGPLCADITTLEEFTAITNVGRSIVFYKKSSCGVCFLQTSSYEQNLLVRHLINDLEIKAICIDVLASPELAKKMTFRTMPQTQAYQNGILLGADAGYRSNDWFLGKLMQWFDPARLEREPLIASMLKRVGHEKY